MKRILGLLLFLTMAISGRAWASNTQPSSGRRLSYGHWLTCWGGSDERLRRDPPLNRASTDSEVAADQPKFNGSYTFDVKDTWQEEVTKEGESCMHCGSKTCHHRNDNGDDVEEDCGCNYCSWQETETYYRPWSTQTVTWQAEWVQSPVYQQSRQAWEAQGSPDITRTTTDLKQLFVFDPDRPVDFFLFPGEVEKLEVGNSGGFLSSALGGGNTITPTVSVSDARYDYSRGIEMDSSIGAQAQCDDRDFTIHARIHAGERLVTTTPNSIEFRDGWLQGAKDEQGDLTDEAANFSLTDVSEMRYEGQDVMAHYKNNHVRVALSQSHSWLGGAFTQVGSTFEDVSSVVRFPEDPNDKNPPVAVYDVKSSYLLKGRWLGGAFHLSQDTTYEVCAAVKRDNNVYYKQGHWGSWSDWNCGTFSFKPENAGGSTRDSRGNLNTVSGKGVF